jgi:UDP-N-acetyl-D-mannosaminuronic acid dehydrogenase
MQNTNYSLTAIGQNNITEINTKFRHLCTDENASIIKAMQIIETGRERICFVIDSNDILIRVVSDGDIRRALLKGYSPSDPVRDIHHHQPVVARNTYPEQMLQHLNKWLMIIPVVDLENKIIGIIRFNDFSSVHNVRQKSVAVLGLGYVGLTLAVVLADNGFSVVGLDKNEELVEKLLKKEASFYEYGLENLLQTHVNGYFKPTTSPDNVLAEIYVITVGTPIVPETKKPNLEHIKKAVIVIAGKLKNNDLVVLRSTVPVGCTRKVVIPLLEELSGLKAGNDFFVAFCPERTAEGRALIELRELPQVVGGFDQNSRQMAMRFFNENTHTVIDVGSLEAAEICKLLDNTYRDTIFAYANQMALLTERLGLNLNELVTKVNIGYGRNNIPSPSPGVGGPCLSKDPYIIQETFASFGLDCTVTSASRKVNEAAPRLIYNRCSDLLSGIGKDLNKVKVFVIGFAFKGEPVTSDLRDSTTLWFLDFLKEKGVENIWGYDPIVEDSELEQLGVKASTLEEGFKNASAIFLMNNHRSYLDLNINNLLKSMNKPAIFYDSWNIFHAHDIQTVPGIHYAALGVG